MRNVTDLLYFRRMKELKEQITPIVIELDKFSKFLYDNTNRTELWDLLIEVESVKIQLEFELSEANKIIAFSKIKED